MVSVSHVMTVGDSVAMSMPGTTDARARAHARRSGMTIPSWTVMSQTTHGHGGESDATEREAGQVEVHQLARSVCICSLTIHETPGA